LLGELEADANESQSDRRPDTRATRPRLPRETSRVNGVRRKSSKVLSREFLAQERMHHAHAPPLLFNGRLNRFVRFRGR
jgi:hypothetical protein